MSHQVLINFAGESIKLSCQCNLIEDKLNEVRSTLEKLHSSSSSLLKGQVAFFENELKKEESEIRNNLESYRNLLAEAKNWDPNTHTISDLQNIRKKAADLSSKVSELTGSKLIRIQTMISKALESSAKGIYTELQSETENPVSEELRNNIEKIEDENLRFMVFEEALKKENKGKSASELIEIAEKGGDSFESSRDIVLQRYREKLNKEGLDTAILKEFEEKPLDAKAVNRMENEVNDALVTEAARRQTLKIIIKNIKDRGFLIDKHNDIKLDRSKNVVKVRARRVDGKQAEFEISLNGKFMYHFENYEGQACQKDIKPFMDDLEKVYGLHVLDQKVIWSNPDKLSTQKYQYIDHNKGKN